MPNNNNINTSIPFKHRVGLDKFIRPSITVGPGSHDATSIDLVSLEGKFIARLNLFSNYDGSWLDIDVIKMEDEAERKQVGRFLAMEDGVRVVDQSLENTFVFAIEFKDLP